MYQCICGREFHSSQSYNAHQGRCKVNRVLNNKPLIDTLNIDRKPWNKGLTKDTDDRVRALSEKLSTSMLGVSHPQSDSSKKKISSKMKISGGGYRKGSGRGKQGRYQGIWCDSSWELAYLVYCLDHGVSIERNQERFEYHYGDSVHKYIPDFKVEGSYVEIKGYETDKDLAKYAAVPDLTVIKAPEIYQYIEYVVSIYGENFLELYDT